MSPEELKKQWTATFTPLVGRTIAKVYYMNQRHVDGHGWTRAPLVIQLDDGTCLYASADDEGNDAGAMFLAISEQLKAKGVEEVAPVI